LENWEPKPFVTVVNIPEHIDFSSGYPTGWENLLVENWTRFNDMRRRQRG
jgi:hypothetical protein